MYSNATRRAKNQQPRNESLCLALSRKQQQENNQNAGKTAKMQGKQPLSRSLPLRIHQKEANTALKEQQNKTWKV